LRKNIFTLLGLSFVVAISTCVTYAQDAAAAPKVSADKVADDTVQLMRQDIRSERKKIVAANLPLTEDEAVKFWPVYDRYVVDHSKIYDSRYALIKEYAQSYNTLTDEQARSFVKRWTTTEQDMAQLRLKWMPEFEKVISAKKTAMFYQIDRRLGYMVELQLSSQIPLVKP
jgi:anti-sigma-K factor RskA